MGFSTEGLVEEFMAIYLQAARKGHWLRFRFSTDPFVEALNLTLNPPSAMPEEILRQIYSATNTKKLPVRRVWSPSDFPFSTRLPSHLSAAEPSPRPRFEAHDISDVSGVDLLLIVRDEGKPTKLYTVNLLEGSARELDLNSPPPARPETETASPGQSGGSQGGGRPITEKQRRQARLRRQYAGRWIGWSPGFEDVIVHSDTVQRAKELGALAGRQDLIYEFVPEVPSRDKSS